MRAAWVLVLAAACKGGGVESPPALCSTGCTPDASPLLALCAVCMADGDCASGVCRMYGDGYRKCSTSCQAGEPAMQCTAPAPGGCNNMGFCMCPQIQMPMDAGPEPLDAWEPPVDAAEAPIDAPMQ